jgi:hypothetical protein
MKATRAWILAAWLGLPCAAYAGHEHHGGADKAQGAAEIVPDAQGVAEIAPVAQARAGCEKCRKMGMGGMHGGDKPNCMRDGGMPGHQHAQGGGDGREALERRVDELEKRLDLMQMLLMKQQHEAGTR